MAIGPRTHQTPLDAIIAAGFRGGDFQPERGRYGNWTSKSTRTVTFRTSEHEREHTEFPPRSWRYVATERIDIALHQEARNMLDDRAVY